MKRPTVDYRKLRINNLNSQEFSHLKLLLSWVFYFIAYFLTETLIPAENCHVIYCFIDDLIPFQEIFLIPYVGWYFLIIFSLGYFGLYDIDSFKKLSKYIIVTQVVAMVIYVVYPNRQDLRPEVFPRDNILTEVVQFLYRIDTNTGVCPSLHVAYSMGIASVWLKRKETERIWKTCVLTAVVLICLSTMFIKQHSALDFLAAIPVCILAEYLVFYREI